jgi:hypothetical protein
MSDTDIFSLNACYLSADISCNTMQNSKINELVSKPCVTTNACNSEDTLYVSNKLKQLLTIEDKLNKTRTIQLNSYFGKKYSAQNYVLKIIGLMFFIVAGLWAIGVYVPSIPSWILQLLVSMTIGICSIIIIFKSVDITNRNKFDYDQYDTKMNNLPPIDDPIYGDNVSIGKQYSYGNFGKHCKDNKCCPKFFTFNPSVGYCSFNPITSLTNN